MLGRLGRVFGREAIAGLKHGTASIPGTNALKADFSVNTTESWFFY